MPDGGAARAPRLVLLGRRPPGARDPGRVPARPVPQPGQPRGARATTGPEIWRQTAGRITHFVAGIGTGGTITGVGRYLKAQNPDVQIVGADPEGSVYSGGTGRPYLVEGIGEDFWPTTYDPSRRRPLGDGERPRLVPHARGGSRARRASSSAARAAPRCARRSWSARELGPDDVVVVLLPDSGRGYLSKIFNDEWMADYGFLRAERPVAGDVLDAQGAPTVPTLVHVTPTRRCATRSRCCASSACRSSCQRTTEPPLAAEEVVGARRTSVELMDRAFRDPAVLDRPVGEVMGAAAADGRRSASRSTSSSSASSTRASVLVLDGGHPIGVLTPLRRARRSSRHGARRREPGAVSRRAA